MRGAPNKILMRLRRDPRPLRTVVARSSHRQPGQSERLSPLGRRRPARRCRRDREFRPSRPFPFTRSACRAAVSGAFASTAIETATVRPSRITAAFDLFAKPENFNEMPFSAGSAPTQRWCCRRIGEGNSPTFRWREFPLKHCFDTGDLSSVMDFMEPHNVAHRVAGRGGCAGLNNMTFSTASHSISWNVDG